MSYKQLSLQKTQKLHTFCLPMHLICGILMTYGKTTMGKPVSMKDALRKTLDSLGLRKRIREAGASEVWAEVVGERIDKVTRVVAVREGVVYLSVESPTWGQELSMMKLEIIDKLNERLGEKVITDIRFR
jgi:predicted nucleic acid-binding Zn ribbon protein